MKSLAGTTTQTSFLRTLADSARKTLAEGYYRYDVSEDTPYPVRSFRKTIAESQRIPVITEIKFVSPADGVLRSREEGVTKIAAAMERGGAVGISVLTEPRHFGGKLRYLAELRKNVGIPLLMKDIIVDPQQIKAGKASGADAVLLISSIFGEGHSYYDARYMIDYAHSLGLEVLLEVHDVEEFRTSMKTGADLIGINNRNLRTLEVSLETSRRLLQQHHSHSKPVVCESGLKSRRDLLALRELGADAFLIGSSVMQSESIEKRVRSFTTLG